MALIACCSAACRGAVRLSGESMVQPQSAGGAPSSSVSPFCDLDPYPTVKRIYEGCERVEAFALAHPVRQPDAVSLD
jgi:hypothetical protein